MTALIPAEFRWDLKLTGCDARLYRLAEPLHGFEHVIVSAYIPPSGTPETYIFGADLNGNRVSSSELPGSFQGSTDHAAALARAGYRIAEEPRPSDDVRDLLDEADARMTHWATRHDPGHALNVRTAGAEAADALEEAARLLATQAREARTEVDAYDAQQLAFLESAHLDTEEGDAARERIRVQLDRKTGGRL